MLLSSQDLPSKLTQGILTSRDPGRLLETSVFCHVGLFVGLLMTWQPTSPRMSDPKEKKVEETQDRSCIPSLLLNAIGHAKQIWYSVGGLLKGPVPGSKDNWGPAQRPQRSVWRKQSHAYTGRGQGKVVLPEPRESWTHGKRVLNKSLSVRGTQPLLETAQRKQEAGKMP